MSYQVITDFRGGLDARKFRLSLPPGTLTSLVNGHITQGGEIEKRKAFVPTSLPANTFGACPVPAGIMVFGSNTPVTIGAMPAGFFYTQLMHPDGATAMSSAVSSTLNGDYPFVIAKFADGKSFAYYNGALVNDFTSGLVMAHLNTNAKIAAALTDVVNQTGNYTAIQDPSPNDNDFDVFSQPGNSYAASLSIASTCNITVTTTDDTSFTGAILTSTNGLNAVDGAKLTLGGKNYTFKTALTPTEGEVLIAATIAATMTNLFNAINHTGTPNTDYKCATANANFYAQNLVTAGTPTFQAVALVANVQGDVENNLAGVTYEDDAPTVTKAVAVQAIGQFKISALNGSALATATLTQDGSTTAPSNSTGAGNNTVTVGGQIYFFKTTPSANYHVKLNTPSVGDATPAYILALMALQAVVNGVFTFQTTSGGGSFFYPSGWTSSTYPPNPNVIASGNFTLTTASYITFNAIASGIAGNFTLIETCTNLVASAVSPGVTAKISGITVGPIFASGTFTTNGTTPSNTDTVTIGSITYTFKTVLAATNDIQIGANANTTLQNLIQAINGTGIQNFDYIIANPHPQVRALSSLSSGILRLVSLLAGAAQNSIGLAATGTTLTTSGATLTGGSDNVSLIAGDINSFTNQTLNNFANQTINAINAYTPMSGYTGTLIGNMVYIYSQSGNSFSNNADITVTVVGQVAIGFCAFLISNGINDVSGLPSPAVNANNDSISGKLTSVQVDGFAINSQGYGFIGSSPSVVVATISELVSGLAGNINANTSAGINSGIIAVAVGNAMYLAKLVTKSSDTPLNVLITFNKVQSMSALQIAQDTLVAVVSPIYIGFLRYQIGGTFKRLSAGDGAAAGAITGGAIGGLAGGPIGLVAGAAIGAAYGAIAGALSGSSPKEKTSSYSPIVATCQVTGGYPPYKYLWQKQDGADGFTFSAPTAPNGTFFRQDNAGANHANWVCTVTDNLGNSVDSNSVKVKQP